MIGVIADDFTGGSDVAVAFRRRGLRTVLLFGPPTEATERIEADVVVVALKSRTIPPAEAVAVSLDAARWLRAHGAKRLYFKYCSTFDSTPRGNIGPVSDALLELLDTDIVPMTPASPLHGRTQFKGHLFVGDRLLGESHMRDHPLTPMTDSALPRVMEAQSRHRVGTVALDVVRQGPERIRARIIELAADGARYALLDAVTEEDLASAGEAVQDYGLVTGAAGLAEGMAAARSQGRREAAGDPRLPSPGERAAVLAGSCSARTLEQIAALHEAGRPSWFLDPLSEQDPRVLAEEALDWHDGLDHEGSAPLVYSSVEPKHLRTIQRRLGTETASIILETAIGLVAIGLVERGVRTLVCAGGETSGAIVSALQIEGGEVGAEAAAGVPWIFPSAPTGLSLLLKSGNFGSPDLLVTASGPTAPSTTGADSDH